MSDAFLSLLAILAATIVALVSIRDRVGPLLVLARGLDRLRAACYCLELSYAAAIREWRIMWEPCLSKAQRSR